MSQEMEYIGTTGGPIETSLQTGDVFRFLEEEKNIKQDWLVTAVWRNFRGDIIIEYEPEFTPVANGRMCAFVVMKFTKIRNVLQNKGETTVG